MTFGNQYRSVQELEKRESEHMRKGEMLTSHSSDVVVPCVIHMERLHMERLLSLDFHSQRLTVQDVRASGLSPHAFRLNHL